MSDGRRLRGISGERAVRAFEKSGYVRKRQRGSHVRLLKPGGTPLTIPLHRELKVGLLQNQIRKAGLTEEDFITLLGG